MIAVFGLRAGPAASAQQVHQPTEARQWVIESVGRAAASPDIIHLMMKMEYQAAQAAEATRRGEKQLADFLAAIDALKIPNLSYQVFNNVIMPAQGPGNEVSGFVYTRNVVFTLRQAQSAGNSAELDRLIAQLEDLGARYNSHCVTCVGSG
jgi:uncharacterized protein YggE